MNIRKDETVSEEASAAASIETTDTADSAISETKAEIAKHYDPDDNITPPLYGPPPFIQSAGRRGVFSTGIHGLNPFRKEINK